MQIGLTMTQTPVYVHPPAVLGPEGSESSRYDKEVTGFVNISASEAVHVGVIKVAWELGHHADDSSRVVLARYETVCQQGEADIGPGRLDIPFSLLISHLLPPYTRSHYDLITHRVFVSIMAPLPTYIVPEAPTKSEVLSESKAEHVPVDAVQPKGFLRTPKPRTLEGSRMSSTPVVVPFSPSQTIYNRTLRLADVPLPESLTPSLAYAAYTTGVISCPDPPGEEPVMAWEKRMRISGLGQVECKVYSSYFACGSGVDFHLSIDDLGSLTTIHSLRFLLGERAVAGDACKEPGSQHDTWFTLYSQGEGPTNNAPSRQYIWRASIPRVYDAKSRIRSWKRILSRNVAPTPMTLPRGFEAPTDDSLRLTTDLRLPSPINGSHATSPVHLDPRITRISHRLRLEIEFSVLGEDDEGRALGVSSNGLLPEGTLRRLWVEHPVVLRCCVLGPDNTVAPTYDEVPNAAESFEQYLARVDIRRTPTAFAIKSTDDHIEVGEGGDLRERVEEHINDCVARCLCFYGDGAVFDLVKRKSDNVQAESLVKASYL